jgi:hypothetical protein
MQTNSEKNIIIDLTFQFALDIIDFTETLATNKKYNLTNHQINQSPNQPITKLTNHPIN